MELRRVESELEFRKVSGYKGELNFFCSDFFKKYSLCRKAKYKEFFLVMSKSYVIPVMIRKVFVFRFASLESEPFRYSHIEENLKDYLNSLMAYLKKKEKIQWIGQTPVYAFFDEYPDGCKTIKFGSRVLDLSKTEEEIWKSLSSTFRTMVRRGQKGEIAVSIGKKELVSDFCIIETEMWARSNVNINHKSDSFYSDLYDNMPNNILTGIGYKNKKPQVGITIYKDNYRAYAMMAGRVSHSEPGANNLLYWEMLNHLKKIGLKEFIIVGYRLNVEKGSKLYNIQKFKDDFKCELRVGYMFKTIFNKFCYYTYYFLMGLIRLTRGKISFSVPKDIIDQEIHKWGVLN